MHRGGIGPCDLGLGNSLVIPSAVARLPKTWGPENAIVTAEFRTWRWHLGTWNLWHVHCRQEDFMSQRSQVETPTSSTSLTVEAREL